MKIDTRKVAFTILNQVEKETGFASDLLDKAFSKKRFSKVDRSLITELVYGCIRRKNTIDWLIDQFAEDKTSSIKSDVKNCIRLGVYQIYFLSKIPSYAAVNESVRLIKTTRFKNLAPFVNALLRNAASSRNNVVYPHIADDPLHYISIVFSHPEWLVKRWLDLFGADKTIHICKINNLPAKIFIRVNKLRITPKKFLAILKKEKIKVASHKNKQNILVLDTMPDTIDSLRSYQKGLFVVQDISTLKAVELLAPKPNENILDLCSAPGGKTTYIAELMNNKGSILAVDIGKKRMAKLVDNCRRLGIDIVKCCVSDGRYLEEVVNKKERFDRVLVDVPCTNLGVIRRRVEVKCLMSMDRMRRLSSLQLELLASGALWVKDGGVLVYSTCSIDPFENEDVVKKFLKKHPAFRLVTQQTFMPDKESGDGCFVAKMVKRK